MEAAYSVVRRLLLAEYPHGRSLADIAETWGGEVGVTTAELDAIRRLEEF